MSEEKELFCGRLFARQIAQVRELSERLRIPMSVIIREALDIGLEQWEHRYQSERERARHETDALLGKTTCRWLSPDDDVPLYGEPDDDWADEEE